MKKVVLLLTALAIWQHWDRIEPLLARTDRQQSNRASEVILYATSWCGYCAKTREFLHQRGIAYIEVDIEKSAEGRRAYDALGGRGVPLLKVNNTLVHGYDPQAILAAY
jgi:mycoredoxin